MNNTDSPDNVGLIAGNGNFPLLFIEEAKKAGVKEVIVVAFKKETKPEIEELADKVLWIKVGELNKLIKFFKNNGVTKAAMAGQITPTALFSKLKLDLRMIKLLASLKNKKADTIFGGIADELEKDGIILDDSTRYLKSIMPAPGLINKVKPNKMQLEDIDFGLTIAKEIGRLDIGQTVVVKEKAILAVEGFEGTNECIKRGGMLGKKNVVVVKTSKPDQDMRFDVPVVGEQTLKAAIEAKASVIAFEAEKTLLLDKEIIIKLANKNKISLIAVKKEN